MPARILEWVDEIPPRKNPVVAHRAALRKAQSPHQRLINELRKHPNDFALIDVVPAKQAKRRQAQLRSLNRRNPDIKIVQRMTEDMKHVRFYAKSVPSTNGL